MIRLRDFDPLDEVAAGNKVSYRARSRASGASLLVHLFRGMGMSEGERLISSLSRFPSSERARILDFGRDQGAVFFLTLDLPGDVGFTEWTESVLYPGRVRTPPPAPVVAPPPVQAAPVPAPVPERPAAPPRPAAPVLAAPPPAEPPRRPSSDGFTMFYEKPAPAPAPRVSEPDTSNTTSADFDRFYGDQLPSPPPPRARVDYAPPPPAARSHESPMAFFVPGDSGSPNWPRPADPIPAPAAKPEIQPLFVDQPASRPRRPEPDRRRERARPPERSYAAERDDSASQPASLRPLLATMGIILAVVIVIVVVAVWYFGR